MTAHSMLNIESSLDGHVFHGLDNASAIKQLQCGAGQAEVAFESSCRVPYFMLETVVARR
jgi:hypothetical protein